jgi:NADH-quinone oxidoreductase subunit M
MTTGIILGAAYMLYLYRRVVFGKLDKDDVKAMPDLSLREIALLAPIIGAVFWMGIYPESFLKPMRADVGAVLARIEPANPGGDAKLAMGEVKPVEAHHGEAVAAEGRH